MKYIVIELQTQNGIVSNTVTSYDSKEQAEPSCQPFGGLPSTWDYHKEKPNV